MRTRIALCAALATLGLGCSKEKKQSLTEPASLFVAADLAAGTNVKTLEADEVAADVDSNETLSAGGAALGGSGLALADETDACTTAKLRALPVTADKINLTVRGTVDLSSCADGVGAMTTKTNGATMKILLYVGCLDDDLSAYDGKTVGELIDQKVECVKSETQKRLSNVELSLSTTTTLAVGGDSVTIDEDFHVANALQNTGGGTCSATVNGTSQTWKNDCHAVDRMLVTKQQINGEKGADEGQEQFSELVFKDLVEEVADAAWYASGSFNVRFGNWTGNVKYTSSTTPPSYTLSDGAQTLSGVVGRGSTTSLALAELPVAGARAARALHEVAARHAPDAVNGGAALSARVSPVSARAR